MKYNFHTSSSINLISFPLPALKLLILSLNRSAFLELFNNYAVSSIYQIVLNEIEKPVLGARIAAICIHNGVMLFAQWSAPSIVFRGYARYPLSYFFCISNIIAI